MKTITSAVSTLAAVLVLAAGTAAAAKDPPSNRGYVVGSGGPARLADGAGTQDETTPAGQTVSTETQAQRLTIKTKSSPRVAEPIGVNEPGVNRRTKIEALTIKQKAVENAVGEPRSQHKVDQHRSGRAQGDQPTDHAESEGAKVTTPSGNTRGIPRPN